MMTLVIDGEGVRLYGYALPFGVFCGGVIGAQELMEHPERIEIELLHECNDCGIKIPTWRPICTLCERWYEDRGMPLPKDTDSYLDLFACRVCGKKCDTAPDPPDKAVCPEHLRGSPVLLREGRTSPPMFALRARTTGGLVMLNTLFGAS